MSVKVSSNSTQIIGTTRQKSSIALRYLLDGIQDESTPKTPKRFGNLRQNVRKQVLGTSGKIQWNQRYAAFQEDKRYGHYTTAGTGPHFARDAVETVVRNSPVYFRKAGLTDGTVSARRNT